MIASMQYESLFGRARRSAEAIGDALPGLGRRRAPAQRYKRPSAYGWGRNGRES
jgi:hypothetical protein